MVRSPYPSINQEHEEEGKGAYDEGNDPEFEGAPHMAGGGYLPSPMPSPDIITAGLTPGTSEQRAPAPMPMAPTQNIVQDGKNLAFTPGQNGSLTVQGPPAAKPDLIPQKSLPGMPPTISSEEVENYISGKKNDIAKYGAADQMALENAINEKRDSAGYRAVDAGKGFADALMQGVARAGNPNWQGQFEANQNEMGNQQMAAMRGANEANLKQTEAGMNLDKMDAKSVLSKQAQATYAPLFQKLGYQPDAIGKMSAANIENALGLMTQFGGEQVKAEIQKMQFGLELAKLNQMSQNLQSEIENRKQSRDLESDKMKHEATVELGKMPWWSRLLHPGVANAFKEEAGLGETFEPDVMNYAKTHNITPEQAYNVKRARGG